MHDEEESIRSKLKHETPGTALYRALQADLAGILHERGDLEGAVALYAAILNVTPAIEDYNGGGTNGSAAVPPEEHAEVAGTRGLAHDGSEEGDWEEELGALSLSDRSPGNPRKDAIPFKQPSPASSSKPKRPDRAIYVPRRQAEAQAKAAEAKEKALARAHAAALKASEQASQTKELRVPVDRPPSRGDLARLIKGSEVGTDGGQIPFGGRHVLEIVGIKRSDSDADLLEYIAKIQDAAIQPVLKWADDTHALIVCADVTQAEELMAKAPEIGRLWLRPYEQASPACRQIAASELLPPTARPRTTAVVARRLLSNALQNRQIRDLAGESSLRAQRREKMAQKEKRQQDLDAAWEDE